MSSVAGDTMDQDPALVHLETETETPSGTQQTEDVPKVVLHFYLNCHVGPGPVLSSVLGVPQCSPVFHIHYLLCLAGLAWPGTAKQRVHLPARQYRSVSI